MRLLKLYSQNKHLKAENERLKADLAALQPVKRLDAPDLEFAFKDLDGKSYYRIPATLAMPLERFGKAQEFIMWMSAGMSATELKALTAVLKKEYEKCAAGDKTALVRCGAVITEIEMRQELIMHTELLYEFLAVNVIREDERPEKYSEEIQQEKIAAFKEMVKAGGTSYPFFQVPELQRVNETLRLSPEDWEKFWNQSIREQQALKEKIKYLKSVARSKPERKTTTIN